MDHCANYRAPDSDDEAEKKDKDGNVIPPEPKPDDVGRRATCHTRAYCIIQGPKKTVQELSIEAAERQRREVYGIQDDDVFVASDDVTVR